MNVFSIEAVVEELGIDLEDILPLYEMYFEEMERNIEIMKKLLSEGNWTGLQEVVHGIKGVSANLFVTDIQYSATRLNELLKNEITEESVKYVEEIERLFLQAKDLIQESLEES